MTENDLTAEDVAKLLGIRRRTVLRWARRGVFPGAYMMLGSRRLGLRIPPGSVRALLRDSERVEVGHGPERLP